MIVRSSTGQSAAGIMIAGAASINVPGAIATRANTPRPRVGVVRISMRWFDIGCRLAVAAANTLPSGLGVLARTIGSSRRCCRARRGARRRHLRLRRRLGLVLLFHPCLEGFDAFGEITHNTGQFPGAEKDQ